MKRCLACEVPFEAEGWNCPTCGHTPVLIGGYKAFAPELAEENDGMESSSHGMLDRLQSENFWFRSRNRLIKQLARTYFPSAKTIIEIGCGTGYVLEALQAAFPKGYIVGSEIYANGLAATNRRLTGAGEVLQLDARHMPYEAEFDLVCAFDVLEHISEDEDVLSEIFRIVHPGGGVLLSVPQHPFLWSPVDDFSHHKRRYATSELQKKCTRAGFTILRSTSFVSSLLPIMAAQRLRQRGAVEFDPTAEYKISPCVNRALEVALDAERLLIKAGVSLPAGGSRFVIAQRPH